MAFLRKAAVICVAALALSGCGSTGLGALGGLLGNGGGGLFSSQCDPGTQVQLANPLPNQTNVPGNIGQITIVANGNNNALYNSHQQWQIVLQDSFGNRITGSTLNLTSDANGPHPYASDYYYSSTIPSLNYGTTYTAYLNYTQSNCNLTPLQSFST